MSLKPIFGIIASIIFIISFIPYLRDIFRRTTQPHLYSWLIWAILLSVNTVAVFVDGGGWGTIAIGINVVVCIIIFLLSFKFGTKNITRFDTIILIAAIATIVLWLFTKDPLLSVILVTVIDFIAFLPTYRKGYAEPATETASLFTLSALGNVFIVLALSNYSVVTTLHSASLVLTNLGFVLMLFLRRQKGDT